MDDWGGLTRAVAVGVGTSWSSKASAGDCERWRVWALETSRKGEGSFCAAAVAGPARRRDGGGDKGAAVRLSQKLAFCASDACWPPALVLTQMGFFPTKWCTVFGWCVGRAPPLPFPL